MTLRLLAVRVLTTATVVSGLSFAQEQFHTSLPPTQLPNQPTGQEHLYPFSDTAMGDITGDGVDDMLFGFVDTSGSGQVLKSGAYDGATGQFLPMHEHADALAAPYSIGNWGSAICVIGDMDGDGSSEYAVGDFFYGRVVVYWGVAPATPFSDNIMCIITKESGLTNPHFGAALSRAGDMNGDGVDDLLIGDWSVQTGTGVANVAEGAVYIISGYELEEEWKYSADGFDSQLPEFPQRPSINAGVNIGKITRPRQATGDKGIGRYIAGGMDATGDGTPDILISVDEIDWVQSAGSTESGVLFYNGRRTGQPLREYSPSTTTGIPSYNQSQKYSFGASLCFVGNVEAMGPPPTNVAILRNDILIGDPGNWQVGDPGFAFVFSSANGALQEVHEGSISQGRGSGMGARVASAGDILLNNTFDGFGDYYVAEPRFLAIDHGPAGWEEQGRVSLVRGKSSLGTVANSSTYPDIEVGASPNSQFGRHLCTSGLPQVLRQLSGSVAPGFMVFTNLQNAPNDPNAITSIEFH